MKITYLFFAAALIISSCQSAEEKAKWEKLKTSQENSYPDENTQVKAGENNNSGKLSSLNSNNSNKFWEELVWNNIYDQKGRVICSQPVPSSWKFTKGGANPGSPVITGPGGLKIYMMNLKSFSYYNDPSFQQSAAQVGMQLRRMPPVSEIISQDIIPQAESKGLQFVRQYELPEVAKVDKWYNDQLYKVAPSNFTIKSIGTEWKDAGSNPHFMLVNITCSEDQSSQMWGYYGYELEAQPQTFDRARKQLTFFLANTQYNLAPIQEYNEQEARKAGISWANHNAKMAANQANFQAQQRAHVNSSEAINDAIMSNYRSSSASSDINQEKFIDAMKEQTNVVDHSTGKEYKVQSHYNKYWMNSNGEYISTDKHTYDPNVDVNMNQQKWEELQRKEVH